MNSGLDPFIGLPIRYPFFPHVQAEQQIAVAIIHNGQPVVLFGPSAAQRLGPLVMGYVLQHEYAHHDLGHTRMGTGSVAPLEADADCQAAKVLASVGRNDVISQTIQFHASQGCGYNPATPLNMVRDSHPCGTQRAQIINSCANSNGIF